ncbi:MAG: hypothetical protein MJZ79_00010 [Paludibacteraceae bacterium]|nr:hypothetical protein [Paludibacteraceae bacterium]
MTVTFENPLIQSVSGSLSKNSPYYYRSERGKTILCRKPTLTPKWQKAKQSPDALQRQEKFKKMVQIAHEILAAPTLRQVYEERYKKEGKGKTLQGFVMSVVSKEYCSPINN